MIKTRRPEEVQSDLVKLLKMEEKLFSRIRSLRLRGCGQDYEQKLAAWELEHLRIQRWAQRMIELPELKQQRGRSARRAGEETGSLSFIPFDLFSDYVEMRIIESLSTYICDTMLPKLTKYLGPVPNGPRVLREELITASGPEALQTQVSEAYGIAS